MASSSKYKKDIADYDSFNARISKLKLKQANTPRKQHAADEFAVHYKEKENVKYVGQEVVHCPKTPTTSVLEEIKNALEHEKSGSLEVALRKYHHIAEKLSSQHPSYGKIMERIEALQEKSGLSERDMNMPTTPAQLIKSTLKSYVPPVFSPVESENEANISWNSPERAVNDDQNDLNKVDEVLTKFSLLNMDKQDANREVLSLLESQVVDILNKGDVSELVKLPGIAVKRAQYIIEYREEESEGFKNIDDLTNIGLSSVQVQKMKTKLLTSQLF